MFGINTMKRDMKKLEYEIKKLKEQLNNEKESKPIGELYCVPHFAPWGRELAFSCQDRMDKSCWVEIRKGDIQERHNGEFKIFQRWHKEGAVYLYSDPLATEKKKRVKLLSKELKK